jgi:drug/metabolite transporter (DMT)-like permease
MSGTALALVLSAAALHAAWNLGLARSDDPEAAAAALQLFAPVLFVVPAALLWRVEAEAVPYVIASGILHFLYFGALAAAYARADMSVVYPISRGLGPVIVLVFGALVLGTATSGEQVAGVALVALGVVLVRGIGGDVHSGDLLLALFVAGTIGAYTLVDAHGVQHANPVAYLELSLAGAALLSAPITLRRRGRDALVAELRPRSAALAAASFGAYGLVLAALQLAPAAAVAAVRESSVVIAALLAKPLLGEEIGWRRLGGAVAVAGGVALLALG